jgi:predicted nucleotidyltransferase component of viral defense system
MGEPNHSRYDRREEIHAWRWLQVELVAENVNAPTDLPASATPAGLTLAPEELAGHKLLALFDRAAARDFVDVYVLARRFGKDVMVREPRRSTLASTPRCSPT